MRTVPLYSKYCAKKKPSSEMNFKTFFQFYFLLWGTLKDYFFFIGLHNNFKNCSTTGNCPIFTSKGFIDWKPCDMSMSTCPNTSYVSDEVYKCKFCCSSKVSYILLNLLIMQLSYIIRVHYSISLLRSRLFW